MKNPIVLGALALVLLAGPALASDPAHSTVAPKLSVNEIDARVRESGYPTVSSIKLKRDGNYAVKAVDAAKHRVELTMDGATGAVLKKDGKRYRDDDYDNDNDLTEKHAHK